MILQMFSVYDSKASAYLPPFYDNAKGKAVRSFIDVVNDSSHAMHIHPEDYTLFHLGTFDDETAEFDPLLTPVSLGVASEFITQLELPIT